jgi:ABC-type Co2+ transport system permease subunit
MHTPFVERLPAARSRRRNPRAQAVSLLGPATAAAGLIWAILQPYRVTLLHPRGQGLWWLVFEPPLLVVLVGVVFAYVVARPLLSDLEARDAAAR